MKVSLIVCTRNRAARLPEFLARVAALEAPPGGWELIVVDNGSTDATPEVLDRFARSAPFPTRCVRAPDPGLSRARNTGLAEVTKLLDVASRTLMDKGKELTKKRRDAAKRLTALVAKELAAVKMEHTTFEIAVTAEEELAACEEAVLCCPVEAIGNDG